MVRRVITLRFFVGFFGIDGALASFEFRFKECCEDVSLTERPRVGKTLLFSAGQYFRELNACEGAAMNTSACCVSHSQSITAPWACAGTTAGPFVGPRTWFGRCPSLLQRMPNLCCNDGSEECIMSICPESCCNACDPTCTRKLGERDHHALRLED